MKNILGVKFNKQSTSENDDRTIQHFNIHYKTMFTIVLYSAFWKPQVTLGIEKALIVTAVIIFDLYYL